MKGTKRCKRLTAILYILVLSVFVAALAGCQGDNSIIATTEPTDEPAAEPTAELPAGTTIWDMTAVLVNDKGEALETTELSAKVNVWEQWDTGDGRNYYAVYFYYPEDVYNSASGVVPNSTDDTPYNCGTGVGYKGNVSAAEGIQFYFGLDLEKECFIMDIDDDQDVYLIAYRSADADIADLWEHFQDFIDMVPDNFPTIIG